MQGSKESTGTEEEDSSSEDETDGPDADVAPEPPALGDKAEHNQSQPETEAGAEISALVNYVQPVHFSSFENAESTYIYF